MSVLSDLVRERREWPRRRKTVAARHHHLKVIVEATLAVQMCVVICLYHETIGRFIQLLLK